MDTIAAISTATGGAVCIIRISGGQALSIADAVFACKAGRVSGLLPRTAYLGEVFDGTTLLDRAMLMYFAAPNSFTGEDVVEIHCHGGTVTPQRVLDACLNSGARMAQAGEFSRRAFVNGKMDLAAAEGVAELIGAESVAAANAALSLMGGALQRKAAELYDRAIAALAELEASFDYPEEELTPFDAAATERLLRGMLGELDGLANSYRAGRLVASGISVVLVGDPNAGKSSLFNALVGDDRAIVTEIAGTTTDTVTAAYSYKDCRFNVTDTAGLRAADGIIEKKGIERAIAAAQAADVVVVVTDSTTKSATTASNTKPDSTKKPASADKSDSPHQALHDIMRNKPLVAARTKSDLSGERGSEAVSSLTGAGIEQLKQRILQASGAVNADGLMITNARHYAAILKAKSDLTSALVDIDSKPPELTAMDLTAAATALGTISGRTASEDVVGVVFQTFCLGK